MLLPYIIATHLGMYLPFREVGKEHTIMSNGSGFYVRNGKRITIIELIVSRLTAYLSKLKLALFVPRIAVSLHDC